jgi:beta-glucosidase
MAFPPCLLHRLTAVTLAAVAAAASAGPVELDFPARPPAPRDAALEARVAAIVGSMTLAQKVGQMTQAEIRFITPDEVRRFCIGSVLNGGGSWPGARRDAPVGDWLALSQAFYDASMATDMKVPVPVIWGTDAVHGHGNVRGATLFPHNIGLGASGDAALVQAVGAATGRAVRATGIQWVFAPTIAVARDDRWGRTYESFSELPERVGELGAAYVRGLQGASGNGVSAAATAKHFFGDGGTSGGQDQGVNTATRAEMARLHAGPYKRALAAGAQTVMASFNSWNDVARGEDHGKLHGSQALLTGLLKQRMGFDGFVVSDWNGIGQVPGCSNARCAQAINAGIDMVMVPEEWRAFIANTIAQVESGEIAQARIDDAVSRIVRVKLRLGLFDAAPADSPVAGQEAALQDRALARRAVRESLVLLKNNRAALPLKRGARVLVVGRGADDIGMQSGGWSLSWQGTGNNNADFPSGTSILGGLREALGVAQVIYRPDAQGVDPRTFDAVVAVLGEAPYAEGNGDIPPSGTLTHTSRYPEDLAVLRRAADLGRPVVTVFLSGRPLHVNDLLNLSDAFVAAWLPGTEGGGVADLLASPAPSHPRFDFQGHLSFSWPRAACQTPLNVGQRGARPLFPVGYGLRLAEHRTLGRLPEAGASGGCGAEREMIVFRQSPRAPYSLQVGELRGGTESASVPLDPAQTLRWPPGQARVEVSTAQMHTQQDARRVRWTGAARVFAWAPQRAVLSAYPEGALLFDVQVSEAPASTVELALRCGEACVGRVDVTHLLQPSPAPRTIKIPLSCLGAAGADLSRIEEPFSLGTAGAFTATLADIRIVAGAARDADAVRCPDPIAP